MAAFNLENLPVTELYLVDPIAATGTGQTVTLSWREGDNGPFRQVDNTPANDVFLTEIPYTASARLGATKMEGTWLTNGTERWTTEGVREASYILTVRGIKNTETANPPTTSLSRNYRSHLADSLGVCGETWLVRNLKGVFEGATTDETVTAGEALDTTSAALGVSLHTDGKYYKYHSTNYPNLQGIIEQGQNIALDGSFVLKNLKGSSIAHTGLTAGALYYVQDGGTLTTTFASGVAFIGKAKNTTQLDHALQFNASAMSDAQVTAGTDTDPQLISAAQLKLGAETHGVSYPRVVYTEEDFSASATSTNTITHGLGVVQSDVEDGKYMVAVWSGGKYVSFYNSNTAYFYGAAWSASDPTSSALAHWQANTLKLYNPVGANTWQLQIIQTRA